MKKLKETETHKNLMRSFAGESQARNRYTFYAQAAQKQGYPLIQQVFEKTADQEQMHAKVFFEFLAQEFNGEKIMVDADYPVDLYQEDTIENLLASVTAETFEHETVYPSFARIAEEEGFPKIAATFKMIAAVEAYHAQTFQKISDDLKAGKLFKQPEKTTWHCSVCGHLHEGKSAPAICPVCSHPKGYFFPEKAATT